MPIKDCVQENYRLKAEWWQMISEKRNPQSPSPEKKTQVIRNWSGSSRSDGPLPSIELSIKTIKHIRSPPLPFTLIHTAAVWIREGFKKYSLFNFKVCFEGPGSYWNTLLRTWFLKTLSEDSLLDIPQIELVEDYCTEVGQSDDYLSQIQTRMKICFPSEHKLRGHGRGSKMHFSPHVKCDIFNQYLSTLEVNMAVQEKFKTMLPYI